jgi:hypothetical protein
VEEVSSQQREDNGRCDRVEYERVCHRQELAPECNRTSADRPPDDGVTSKVRTLAHLSASNSRLTFAAALSNRIEIDDLVRGARVA